MQHSQNNVSLPDEDEILLGEILTGAQNFETVASELSVDNFPRPAHKQIFQAMTDLYQRREPIDRVMVANELMKSNELQECGGLTYICKLCDYGSYENTEGTR